LALEHLWWRISPGNLAVRTDVSVENDLYSALPTFLEIHFGPFVLMTRCTVKWNGLSFLACQLVSRLYGPFEKLGFVGVGQLHG
jgi:hypothetical protein